MKYLLPLAVVVAFAACQPKKETVETKATPSLTKKWETDTLLTTCESVIYDANNNILYVANINGDPSGKDGNGFISSLGLDGKVVNARWVAGMDAPKGMGIFNGKLYVSDIDRVHEIDIASAKITNTYKYDSAKFLNDITIDSTGIVYVSDSNAGNILKLEPMYRWYPLHRACSTRSMLVSRSRSVPTASIVVMAWKHWKKAATLYPAGMAWYIM
jgi:hypothetical protein